MNLELNLKVQKILYVIYGEQITQTFTTWKNTVLRGFFRLLDVAPGDRLDCRRGWGIAIARVHIFQRDEAVRELESWRTASGSRQAGLSTTQGQAVLLPKSGKKTKNQYSNERLGGGSSMVTSIGTQADWPFMDEREDSVCRETNTGRFVGPAYSGLSAEAFWYVRRHCTVWLFSAV